MQLRVLALLVSLASIAGAADSTESIRGKSDLSPVIASKELSSRKGDLLSGLPEVKDPVEAVADVLGDVVDKKVGGVEAQLGANADNDDVDIMARGIIKHLKRMYAPKHWMLDKLRGRWAPKPSAGPHKLRECMPLIVMLRQRLKYALTYREVKMIVMQRLIKVDGKVRTDLFYPAGFMDMVQIDKTKENFRLLYNTKGRFNLHKVAKEEASYKLCRVKRVTRGPRGVPYAQTHDGRTIRYPDPDIKAHDTIRLDLESGKILDHVKFEVGNMVMISGGNNIGRVGTITHREKHPGSFEIVHIKDAAGHSFNTRLENVFLIGSGNKPWISLPKGNGIKLSIVEDRGQRMSK